MVDNNGEELSERKEVLSTKLNWYIVDGNSGDPLGAFGLSRGPRPSISIGLRLAYLGLALRDLHASPGDRDGAEVSP
jgi:hypothetical protein